jgi:hypothetical protein
MSASAHIKPWLDPDIYVEVSALLKGEENKIYLTECK